MTYVVRSSLGLAPLPPDLAVPRLFLELRMLGVFVLCLHGTWSCLIGTWDQSFVLVGQSVSSDGRGFGPGPFVLVYFKDPGFRCRVSWPGIQKVFFAVTLRLGSTHQAFFCFTYTGM